ITTANALETIPRPLLDRMEIIRLPGYSHEEKAEIAKRYLIPRQWKQVGVTPENCVLTEDALLSVINNYTREAGLRRLERTLGKLARKAALHFAETGSTEPFVITPDTLVDLLGPEPFTAEKARKKSPPGV